MVSFLEKKKKAFFNSYFIYTSKKNLVLKFSSFLLLISFIIILVSYYMIFHTLFFYLLFNFEFLLFSFILLACFQSVKCRQCFYICFILRFSCKISCFLDFSCFNGSSAFVIYIYIVWLFLARRILFIVRFFGFLFGHNLARWHFIYKYNLVVLWKKKKNTIFKVECTDSLTYTLLFFSGISFFSFLLSIVFSKKACRIAEF